jgi:hypothetical protein
VNPERLSQPVENRKAPSECFLVAFGR